LERSPTFSSVPAQRAAIFPLKSDGFKRVDAILRDAAGTRATAIVARVEHRGNLAFERAYGTTRNDGRGKPVYVDTRFDLASLTKLFVSTLALELVAKGRLTLDASLARWIPEWQGTAHEAITTRMLLAHTSGMDSGADYRVLLGQNVERFTLQQALANEPGERVVYSDLGLIALGVLLERIEGRSLSSLVSNFQRESLSYRPASTERTTIPATEEDGWRGRVQGVVHDEKAYLMNGVAGHAGLFGTAADVAWLTERYLGSLRGRARDLAPALAREAVKEQAYDPVLRRGLGWALKTNDENSCGRLFSSSSFGHTGFTGTCVWADPERDVQAVLLTNTVYYGRADSRNLRAAFYESVIEESAV
jgi:serine-type D-Ala-D-Ala carboxypeptidase